MWPWDKNKNQPKDRDDTNINRREYGIRPVPLRIGEVFHSEGYVKGYPYLYSVSIVAKAVAVEPDQATTAELEGVIGEIYRYERRDSRRNAIYQLFFLPPSNFVLTIKATGSKIALTLFEKPFRASVAYYDTRSLVRDIGEFIVFDIEHFNVDLRSYLYYPSPQSKAYWINAIVAVWCDRILRGRVE